MVIIGVSLPNISKREYISRNNSAPVYMNFPYIKQWSYNYPQNGSPSHLNYICSLLHSSNSCSLLTVNFLAIFKCKSTLPAVLYMQFGKKIVILATSQPPSYAGLKTITLKTNSHFVFYRNDWHKAYSSPPTPTLSHRLAHPMQALIYTQKQNSDRTVPPTDIYSWQVCYKLHCVFVCWKSISRNLGCPP